MEQSWQVFKEAFHRIQGLAIPRSKKSGKEGKRLLVKLKGKKKMHVQLRLGWVTQGEHRYKVWLCSDGRRKAKVKMELNLARDAKNNRKSFYWCVDEKRKVKEGVHPLINSAGKLVTKDKEKIEVLNNYFFPIL